MRLSAHGLSVEVPPGWEARILRRTAVAFGEQARPVVHLANFALPEGRGDFGAGVVEHMRSGEVFVVLFDYGTASAHQLLFRHVGLPTLAIADFSPRRLQRTIPGQAGAQRFFTAGGRALCIYVVVANSREVSSLVGPLNKAVAGFGVVPS